MRFPVKTAGLTVAPLQIALPSAATLPAIAQTTPDRKAEGDRRLNNVFQGI